MEFNLRQDIHASRFIFDCGVPLIHVPCYGVASYLITSVPELEYYQNGKNALGDYLVDIVRNYTDDLFAWSKVIWDISTIAWLVNPEWVPGIIVHSPILNENLTWSFNNSRHFIKSAVFVHRDKIFADLFKKLA